MNTQTNLNLHKSCPKERFLSFHFNYVIVYNINKNKYLNKKAYKSIEQVYGMKIKCMKKLYIFDYQLR